VLELPLVHLAEEAYYSGPDHVRMCTAAGVFSGYLSKIHFQGWSSFFYASKRCSSRSLHGIRFLVLERSDSPLQEHPSSLPLETMTLKLSKLMLIKLDVVYK
jgi:hypothetical protein